LTLEQIRQFVFDSTTILNENGVILLMNIPNANLKDLYYAGVFRNSGRFSLVGLAKTISKFKFLIFKERLKNRKYEYDPIFGHWHFPIDFKEIGSQLDLNVEIFQSIFEPYGYRFHVKFSKA